jgi:alpha-D-ribose 1-methylphosphonate 5-triphosphate synthase subunit PhnL
VNIARGFITEHPVLLLDEPTASLDAQNRRVVIAMIDEKKRAGTALLGIFHDEEVREAVADRIIDVTAFRPARKAA